MQVDLRIHASLIPGASQVTERLSVFLDIHDPDGPEDIAWVTVELPDHGVGWQLEGDDLQYRVRGEQHWYGGAGLTVPGWSRFPRGAAVRIITGDFGGRTAEREVRIPPTTVVPESGDFPRLAEGGVLVPAPGAIRHFMQSGDRLLELVIDGASRPYVLGRESRDELGEADLFLIAEVSAFLWLETGPWRYP